MNQFNEELISAYIDGELSPAERAEVERVLAESPEHRRLFDELSAIQRGMRALPVHEFGRDSSPAVLRSAERAKSSASHNVSGSGDSTPSDLPAKHESHAWRFVIAAAVTATAASLLIVVVVSPRMTTRNVAQSDAVESDEADQIAEARTSASKQTAPSESSVVESLDAVGTAGGSVGLSAGVNANEESSVGKAEMGMVQSAEGSANAVRALGGAQSAVGFGNAGPGSAKSAPDAGYDEVLYVSMPAAQISEFVANLNGDRYSDSFAATSGRFSARELRGGFGGGAMPSVDQNVKVPDGAPVQAFVVSMTEDEFQSTLRRLGDVQSEDKARFALDDATPQPSQRTRRAVGKRDELESVNAPAAETAEPAYEASSRSMPVATKPAAPTVELQNAESRTEDLRRDDTANRFAAPAPKPAARPLAAEVPYPADGLDARVATESRQAEKKQLSENADRAADAAKELPRTGSSFYRKDNRPLEQPPASVVAKDEAEMLREQTVRAEGMARAKIRVLLVITAVEPAEAAAAEAAPAAATPANSPD